MPALGVRRQSMSRGLCVHDANNPRERRCACECAGASKDQARLAGEGVKWPGSKAMTGSLKASSGCEGACASLRGRALQGAPVNSRLNAKSTTWDGFRRLRWLLGS